MGRKEEEEKEGLERGFSSSLLDGGTRHCHRRRRRSFVRGIIKFGERRSRKWLYWRGKGKERKEGGEGGEITRQTCQEEEEERRVIGFRRN